MMWGTGNIDLHLAQIKDLSKRIQYLENNWIGGLQPYDPSGDDEYLDLSSAVIVSESTPAISISNSTDDVIWSAKNLFDKYLDPYNPGETDYNLPTYHDSVLATKDVEKPYVIIDSVTLITVSSITFVRSGGSAGVGLTLGLGLGAVGLAVSVAAWGGGDSPLYYADVIAPKWPQQFNVYSAIRETGPWILQGSRNWSELGIPYPPKVYTDQTIQVTLKARATYRFWKLVVSQHQPPGTSAYPLTGGTYSEVAEAVFIGGRATTRVLTSEFVADETRNNPNLNPNPNYTPDDGTSDNTTPDPDPVEPDYDGAGGESG